MSRPWNALAGARVFDLAQPFYVGMPHSPTHPPFLFSLTKRHGDVVGPSGHSSASDAVAMSGHTGTHIDALCHFSCDGKFHGGDPVEGAQSYSGGIERLSVDTVSPILRRGVLLDVAGLSGGAELAADFEILPEHLESAARSQGVEVLPGDVVLLRTGWARYWGDAARYVGGGHGPGPGSAGARWLSERGVFAAGSDTLAFERVPAAEMPVHVHLLVEKGIYILECLNLEELAASRVYEFLFVAAPLKIRGGTGAPVRPLAIAE